MQSTQLNQPLITAKVVAKSIIKDRILFGLMSIKIEITIEDIEKRINWRYTYLSTLCLRGWLVRGKFDGSFLYFHVNTSKRNFEVDLEEQGQQE